MSTVEQRIKAARILVIDDNPVNVEMTTGLLDVGGFSQVAGTTDPAQGLELVRTERWDLLLLDMRMPVIDGAEFIRRLKLQNSSELPAIIVLTVQTDDDTRRAALTAGARDFLVKPFKIWELLQRVTNALEIQVLYRQAREFNNELEARVEERTHALNATRVEVIRRLATAAEFRDNETGNHVARMSIFAHHLALKAGLSDLEAANIRDAAPMHDVGKIGIPDAILLKPGKLTGDEWEIMKTHAAIGGEILSGSPFPLLDLARVIALTHHEKWDGSGYPHGLKGEAIPMAGRIVAVSDVFDALTSDRPYKPGWKIDDAIQFMIGNAGSHFDPTLVGLFHRELPAILELRKDLQG